MTLDRYICLTQLGRSFLEVQYGTENNPTMQFDTTPTESHEQNEQIHFAVPI